MTGLKLLHHLWCAYKVLRCLGSNWRSFGGKADDQRPADYLEGLLVLVMTVSSRSVIGSKGGLRFDEAASRRG